MKQTRSRCHWVRYMLPAFAATVIGYFCSMSPVRAEEQPVDTSNAPTLTLDEAYASVQSGFEQLRPVFERACFDCHSNQTHYPWYHRIPLVKSWIDDDIKDARKHLDLSRPFPFGGEMRPAKQLDEMKDEVTEGDMPPLSYRMMHWSANPSDTERQAILDWIRQSLNQLAEAGVVPEEDEEK